MASQSIEKEITGEVVPRWSLEVRLAPQTSEEDIFSCMDALGEGWTSVTVFNPENHPYWRISAHSAGRPCEETASAVLMALGLEPMRIEILPIPDEDWLQKVYEDFPPITLGGFYIYGSHCEDAPPADKIALKIDAATAFGSGEHQTTQGCLKALEGLRAQGFSPARVLDMGCGSGILAIAARKLWPQATVAAVDIDPESARVTQRHAQMNGCNLLVAAGDGYAAPLVAQQGPYELIIANILAGPLIDMAGDLAHHLRAGGFCVLSGLLTSQKDDVTAAHAAHGLVYVQNHEKEGWETLVLRKKAG